MRLIYESSPSELDEMSPEKYHAEFLSDRKVTAAAFEKAWDARKFEIELYWKRGTYFWTLITTAFLGYFALVNSSNYKLADPANHAEVYFVICIGFVLSWAWLFINKGSKAWQRNWESHVDLLENQIVGPLYKTVHIKETYSVSRINEIVSFMFICVWMLLALKFLKDQNLLNLSFYKIDFFILLSTVISIILVSSMTFGYGRGRFKTHSNFIFHRRVSNFLKIRRNQEQDNISV